MQPLLANPSLKPTSNDILKTRDAFEALLRIRSSSGLFHMQTLAEVQQNLTFLPTQPGIIAMRLNAHGGRYEGYQQILAVFNATTKPASVADDSLTNIALNLHPILAEGDFVQGSGCVSLPALTCAVFVNH
jgi:pullulanase